MLGGNPMNLSLIFCFMFCCVHTIIILLWLCLLCLFLCLSQAKPLWLVWCLLLDPAGKSQERFAHEIIFHFYPKGSFKLIIFAVGWYANFPNSRNLWEVLRYQKYMKYTDCYRLVCFCQILFLLCWLLVLMKLWIVFGGY